MSWNSRTATDTSNAQRSSRTEYTNARMLDQMLSRSNDQRFYKRKLMPPCNNGEAFWISTNWPGWSPANARQFEITDAAVTNAPACKVLQGAGMTKVATAGQTRAIVVQERDRRTGPRSQVPGATRNMAAFECSEAGSMEDATPVNGE